MYIAWQNKLKKQKYHTVRTVPKSFLRIVETEETLTTLTHICITTNSPGLVQVIKFKILSALDYFHQNKADTSIKMAGVN
jgi:hypothetical protein